MHKSRYNIILPVNKEKSYILMNNLTSAMDIVDQEVVDFLTGADTLKSAGQANVLEDLTRRGYVFESEEEEKKLIDIRFNDYETRMNKSTPVFYIIPTYACNLRCSYCFQDHAAKNAVFMDDECLASAFKTMDELFNKAELKGDPYFVIFGGEPLLKGKRPYRLISKILEEANNRGWKPKIVSNGVELEHYADLLSTFQINYIQVTVDGPESIHNKRRISPKMKETYTRILKGVQKTIDKGVKVAVRINVDDQNLPFLPELAKDIIARGWDKHGYFKIYMAPMRDISCMEYSYLLPEHIAVKRIFELFRNYQEMHVIELLGWVGVELFREVLRSGRLPSPQFKFCGASMYRYCFDLHGDIYTCLNCAGVEQQKVGTFHRALAIKGDAMNSWRKRSIVNMPECCKCKLAFVCGGGCPKLAIEKKNDINQPFCNYVEEVLMESAQYYYPFLENKADSLAHQQTPDKE